MLASKAQAWLHAAYTGRTFGADAERVCGICSEQLYQLEQQQQLDLLCMHCGNNLLVDSQFCRKCGAPAALSQDQPQSPDELLAGCSALDAEPVTPRETPEPDSSSSDCALSPTWVCTTPPKISTTALTDSSSGAEGESCGERPWPSWKSKSGNLLHQYHWLAQVSTLGSLSEFVS